MSPDVAWKTLALSEIDVRRFVNSWKLIFRTLTDVELQSSSYVICEMGIICVRGKVVVLLKWSQLVPLRAFLGDHMLKNTFVSDFRQ